MRLNIKEMLFLIILSVSSQALSDNLVNNILAVGKKSDILIWGETHFVAEQTKLLQEFLAIAPTAGYDVIATELVLNDQNELFQNYLGNPDAVKNSNAEEDFFKSISLQGYNWTKSEEVRNSYRTLRDLKQKNKTMVICGIDYNPSSNLNQNLAAWSNFDSKYQELSLTIFAKNKNIDIKKLSEDDFFKLLEKFLGQTAFVREAAMGKYAASCLNRGKKGIVHVGALHGRNPNLFSEKQQQLLSDMSLFLKLQIPNKTMVTLYNTVSTNALQYKQLKAEAKGYPKIIAKKEMDSIIKKYSKKQPDLIQLQLWDFYIIGPQGRPVKNIY